VVERESRLKRRLPPKLAALHCYRNDWDSYLTQNPIAQLRDAID